MDTVRMCIPPQPPAHPLLYPFFPASWLKRNGFSVWRKLTSGLHFVLVRVAPSPSFFGLPSPLISPSSVYSRSDHNLLPSPCCRPCPPLHSQAVHTYLLFSPVARLVTVAFHLAVVSERPIATNDRRTCSDSWFVVRKKERT